MKWKRNRYRLDGIRRVDRKSSRWFEIHVVEAGVQHWFNYFTNIHKSAYESDAVYQFSYMKIHISEPLAYTQDVSCL